MVIILTAVGLAAKWYGSRRKDADEDVQGDDPIVRAMFKAFNDGDLDDLLTHIDADCRVTLNSWDLARSGMGDDRLERGPELWIDAIEDTRRAFPDVRWELYDELVAKDEGEQKIAIRFVSTVMLDGEEHQIEFAAFGVVKDKKVTQWHQVADMESYNLRRDRTGERAVGRD